MLQAAILLAILLAPPAVPSNVLTVTVRLDGKPFASLAMRGTFYRGTRAILTVERATDAGGVLRFRTPKLAWDSATIEAPGFDYLLSGPGFTWPPQRELVVTPSRHTIDIDAIPTATRATRTRIRPCDFLWPNVDIIDMSAERYENVYAEAFGPLEEHCGEIAAMPSTAAREVGGLLLTLTAFPPTPCDGRKLGYVSSITERILQDLRNRTGQTFYCIEAWHEWWSHQEGSFPLPRPTATPPPSR